MINPYWNSMNKRSTQELKAVIAESEKYTPEAIEAAASVLKDRQDISEMPAVGRQHLDDLPNKKKKPSLRYLRHYLRFIVSPDFHQLQSSPGKKILFALRFFFIAFALYIIFLMILNPFLSVLGLHFPAARPVIDGDDLQAIDFVLFVICMPPMVGFMEELTCRLLLTRFNTKYLNISLSLIIALLLVWVVYAVMPMYTSTNLGPTERLLLAYSIIAGFAAIIYTSLSRSTLHSAYLEKNWNTAFKGIFYISVTIFSVLHIPNYNWTNQSVLLLPFVLIPYINYAFLFSLIRIRLGFIYAVGIHALVDLIAVLMFLTQMN